MIPKVFGIGWHKTGTSTLGVALQKLGYNVCPEEIGYIATESAYAKDYRYALRIAKLYEGFQDSPWNYRDMYRVLDVVFPDAKFIYTIRHIDRWYRSLLRWGALYYKDENINILATVGMMAKPDNMLEMYSAFTQNYEAICEYFKDRPNKLLIANWETTHGWQELCAFLGKPVPDEPFPWALRYDPETASYTAKVIHD